MSNPDGSEIRNDGGDIISDEELVRQYDTTPKEGRGVFLKDLPDEKKKVILDTLKARLAQKKEAESQQQQQQQPYYPPPKLGYAYTSGSGGNGAGEFDEFEEDMYDDDDDIDDDYDEAMDHFEAELQQRDLMQGGGTPLSSSDAGSVSAFGGGVDLASLAAGAEGGRMLLTDPMARRKEVGDFELLRLAKMGDLLSFKEFEPHLHTAVHTFFDNNGRDALHYAVDGGCLELVKYLVEQRSMSLRKDEKMKATPLDMAVLLGRAEIARYLTSRFPVDPKSFDEALQMFAPSPPRFCLSKAAPQMQPAIRERSFWTANPAVRSVTEGFRFTAENVHPEDSPAAFETIVAVLNRPACGSHHGIDSWTLPIDRIILSAALGQTEGGNCAPCHVVGVTAMSAQDVPSPAGIGIAIGGTSAQSTRAPLVVTIRQSQQNAAATSPCVLFGAFTVVPLHQNRGINALLMETMKKTLRGASSTAAGAAPTTPPTTVVGVFRCKERLPPQPVSLIKWFRRSLRPMQLFTSDMLLACSEVYPDFFGYDDRLRVDWVAKETPGPAQRTTATLTNWVAFSPETCTPETLVMYYGGITALLKKVTSPEATFLALECTTPEAMLQVFLNAGLQTFVIPTADATSISDIVCLRLRESREQDSAQQGTRLRCATSVFCAFTTITGEKRPLELVAIASNLECDVLYVPNTCGLTDADFSKAMFEESDNCREYLYAVRDDTESEPKSVVAAMMPAAKVFFPLGLV